MSTKPDTFWLNPGIYLALTNKIKPNISLDRLGED
jgi:hypothetical protein